jgi:hypothetical protein
MAYDGLRYATSNVSRPTAHECPSQSGLPGSDPFKILHVALPADLDSRNKSVSNIDIALPSPTQVKLNAFFPSNKGG